MSKTIIFGVGDFPRLERAGDLRAYLSHKLSYSESNQWVELYEDGLNDEPLETFYLFDCMHPMEGVRELSHLNRTVVAERHYRMRGVSCVAVIVK